MAEIADRVHKIEQILYGNQYTKERGIVELLNQTCDDVRFFKRFIKWLAWIGGFAGGGMFALLALGIKYNLNLVEKLSLLTAKLIEHMAATQ